MRKIEQNLSVHDWTTHAVRVYGYGGM